MTDQLAKPLLLYSEDEAIIQLMTKSVLEEAGFELILASSGEEAMDLLATEHGRIDGLVTDVDLGHGPTGWSVARYARMLIARIPVLYASSVSEFEWMTNGVPLSRLLSKPCSSVRMIGMIQTLLDPAHQNRNGGVDGALGDIRSTLSARRAAIARVARSVAAHRPPLLSWA